MTDTTRPDLRPSYLEHRAMRMDAARLTELVDTARPADADRLAAVSDWYTRYEGAIHDHHTAEETVMYPALLERDPDFADVDAELEGQHGVLADRLAVARESIAGLAGAAGGSGWEREHAETRSAARALQDILAIHLGDEERTAFPRYVDAFTADEFADLGKAAFKVVGRRAMVFAGPWVLDHATCTERAELLAAQPALLRVIYRLVLRPRYERLVRPLRPATQTTTPGSEV